MPAVPEKVRDRRLDLGGTMIYECRDCETKFSEMDQTNQEYRNGQCPSCGSEDIKEVNGERASN